MIGQKYIVKTAENATQTDLDGELIYDSRVEAPLIGHIFIYELNDGLKQNRGYDHLSLG